MDRSAFGRLLREARQRSLFTLERLAETSGVSVRAISDMERGRSLPRQSTLSELMDALELDEQDRRSLVRASTRRATRAPQQLPPDLAVFRGREKALETARGGGQGNAERDTRGGVVVIAGMAGVGKTTLAVHWAHRVAEHFPDGTLYVNLRGFDDSGRPLDPGDVLGGFLTALGVPTGEIPRRTGERGALFRERTASLRLIVVLDNARDAEQVAPLLPAASGCLTVVTSRNRLSDLATDSDAALIGLDAWTPDEALTALAARIGDERCRAEPEAAADLVALCGHLPLAVAVVGAQLSAAPRMPLRVAARELREELPRLDALSAGDQRVDLRTVFSWSYRALPHRTARFFRHLALHPGPALTAESAASLAGTGMAEARRHLRELTSASLLSQDAEGRHVLHDLVRAYGTELIEQEQDDRIGAEIRLLDYLRHTAHDASHVLDSRPRQELADPPAQGVVRVETRNREEALDWFRQEEATVAAALRTLEDPRLLRHRTDLVDDWVSYYAVKGRWTEEIAVRRIVVEASRLLDEPVALSKNCAHLARALAESGRLEEADAQVRTMLGLLDRLDTAQRAATERSIGWVRGRQGRHTDALHHARNALALFRALGDEGSEARELNAVGWYLALLGEYREAITVCEAAVPLLRRTGNRRSEAATWDSIGYARQRLGDLDTAIADYETSLRLYAEVLDDYNQAEVLDHLASAHAERGDPHRARASWARAADLLTALHDPRAPDLRAKAESLPPPLPHPDAGTAGQEAR